MSQFDSYKDEEQQINHTRTRIGMGVGFFVLAFALIWLSFKVSRQVVFIRSHFWIYMKRGLLIVFILTLLIALIFMVLNSIAKKKSYDEHYIEDKQQQ